MEVAEEGKKKKRGDFNFHQFAPVSQELMRISEEAELHSESSWPSLMDNGLRECVRGRKPVSFVSVAMFFSLDPVALPRHCWKSMALCSL